MIKIDANELSSILVLGVSKNRVLIVSQRNSNRPVVVKSEEVSALDPVSGDRVTRNNVGAMLVFHGTVFSQLRALPFDTERMTLAEMDALRSCSPNKVTGLKNGETWPSIFNTEIANQNGGRKSLVKISYVEELANLHGMTETEQQKLKIRQALEQGNTDFIVELGQILAVDFFIGNHDRFTDKGALSGPQNIFFSLKGGGIQATGIDTYDVYGEWSDLNKTIEAIEATAQTKWPGRVLAHGARKQRDQIAQTAVSYILIEVYGGQFDDATGGTKPSDDCPIGRSRRKLLVNQFHKGMSEAKAILRKKYKLTDNLASLQAGIRSRWNIIRD